MLNGGYRNAHNRVVILILGILTLVSFECDPAPLDLILIDRFPLAHVPLQDHASALPCSGIVASYSQAMGVVPWRRHSIALCAPGQGSMASVPASPIPMKACSCA